MDLPVDTLGRPISDLRISVTDRCNFRCGFCMPAHEKYRFLPKPEILTFEEIARLAGIFRALGARKIRLTGGEPLLRTDLEKLIHQLRNLGFDDLALTTNGFLLPERAHALKDAGLGRVTISLHSLDPATFGEINGLALPLEGVLNGVKAALAAGLHPVKLNAVVIRGRNDNEIVDLARFGREHGCVVRFIEFMDVGTVNEWDPRQVVTAAEIVGKIAEIWPLEPVTRDLRFEVAERYRYCDGGGEIGVISSISQPFCGDCARARLSADGRLFTCLFGAVGHDLRGPLRAFASNAELEALIRTIWSRRSDRYSEERRTALDSGHFAPTEKIEMFRIGG